MRTLRTPIAFQVSALLLASTVHAQNWTPTEQAVLDSIDRCVAASVDGDPLASLACFHPDFVGWQLGMPGTRDMDYLRAENAANPGDPLVAFSIQPLSVKVYGNVAIIHYYGYNHNRNSDGEVVVNRTRWTDVMLNEGGRWLWIADHGGTDPGVPPSIGN